MAETSPEHARAPAETAAATAHPHRLGAVNREWAALAFAVVSFVIAQFIVVTLHYRATRLAEATEEVKLARGLYSEFYLDGKSYIPIASAIESARSSIRATAAPSLTPSSTNISASSPTLACSRSVAR